MPAVLTCVPLFIFVDKLATLHFYSLIKQMSQFSAALTGLVTGMAMMFLSMISNVFIQKTMQKINYFDNDIKIPKADFYYGKMTF